VEAEGIINPFSIADFRLPIADVEKPRPYSKIGNRQLAIGNGKWLHNPLPASLISDLVPAEPLSLQHPLAPTALVV
jgi:hypothetical protein